MLHPPWAALSARDVVSRSVFQPPARRTIGADVARLSSSVTCLEPVCLVEKMNLNYDEIMKTKGIGTILFAGIVSLATGCVERRVEYVPVYRSQTVYQTQPQNAQQTIYQSQPGAVQPPSTNWQAAAPAPPDDTAPPPAIPQQPAATVVAQAPPPPQVEVVPVAPGPDYYWVPGYWYWGGPGWIWISGRWTIRPWHGAVWVHGGLLRGRGAWRWHGGHWR